MKIDNNIIKKYNQSKSNLQLIIDNFNEIITKEVIISEYLHYKIKISNFSHDRINILFFENDELMKEFDVFELNKNQVNNRTNNKTPLLSITFSIEEDENIEYKLFFKSIFNSFIEEEIFIIEAAFSFIKKIIKNIENTNYSILDSLFKKFNSEFYNLEQNYKQMKKNKKDYEDYLHSLTFDKIMTLFSKNDKIADGFYEYITSKCYSDKEINFITIVRDFDKLSFKRIKVEAKNNKKLSLMYNGYRISKSDLKNQLKKDIILFNGDHLKSTTEAIDKLNISNLPFYNESYKSSGYLIHYNIDDFFNFFRKHIISNEF